MILTPICDSPTYLGIGEAHSEILYRNHAQNLGCKTVRIVAYSNTRKQSNNRSGTRLKTESETEERRCARKTLTPRFPDSFADLEKNTVLQSNRNLMR